MIESMHSSPNSTSSIVMHADVALSTKPSAGLSESQISTSNALRTADDVDSNRIQGFRSSAIYIPSRKRFKMQTNRHAKFQLGSIDEDKLHEIFPERRSYQSQEGSPISNGKERDYSSVKHSSPLVEPQLRVSLLKSRINRNRVLQGISPGSKPKLGANALSNDSKEVKKIDHYNAFIVRTESLQSSENSANEHYMHLLTDTDAECAHDCRDEPNQVVINGQPHDPVNIVNSSETCTASDCHPNSDYDNQSNDEPSDPANGLTSDLIVSCKGDSIQQVSDSAWLDLKNEEKLRHSPSKNAQGHNNEALKPISASQRFRIFVSAELSPVDETSSKVRIPSVCLMPCKCERCFFAAEESYMNLVWLPKIPRWKSNHSNGVTRRPRSSPFENNGWGPTDGFNSYNGEGVQNQSMGAEDDWAQDRPSNRFRRFRLSRPRQVSFSKHRSSSWSSNGSPNLFSNTWNSPQIQADHWKSAEIPWTNCTSNDLECTGKISEDSPNDAAGEQTNSRAPSIATESSTNGQVPVKRFLSAAEKEAILAKTKFLMRAPVLSTTAIPRLDENNRPRRPLVRPVYSSASTRLNIRPARLVAYRSDSKTVKEDSLDAEDDLLSPSVNDDIPTVSEELTTTENFAEDESEAESEFSYIRYAKGRIGVQLLSFPASSSNVINKGLYCDLVFPRSRQNSLLPLPLSEGAEMLNRQTEFKLPFSMVQSRLAEIELDRLRKTGTFVNNPPPFFIINRNIRLPTTILPEYAGGDEILDCECSLDIDPGCGSSCINRLTHVECESDQCKLGDQCTNQRFQKRQWSKLSLEYMGEKGWGVILAQDVCQGDLIIEHVGELVDLETCKERCRNEYRSEKHFYLLTLYNNIIIDATRRGNIGRFCNHSCEPSCETQKWSVRGSPRIGIFALRDLPKGTEVTLDYNFERIGLAMTKCLCGTESCRGFLGASKSKKKKDQIFFDFDYDIARDGPPILDSEQQSTQLSEYLIHDTLPDWFLSMVTEIGSESGAPALLLRNVIRVHSAFMDRLEYNPGHS